MDALTTIATTAVTAGVAVKLVDKLSDATGILLEPWKIKRNAKADAEAAITNAKANAKVELIKAENQTDISELQRRTTERFLQEEMKKQANLENIVIEKSFPLLSEKATPEKMDDDWIMNYFDKAKLISDEEMQTLWAKILAGEANEPNSFSKRTVNFLASMDKKDAEMFSNLSRFRVNISGDAHPFIHDVQNAIYSDNGVDYSVLSHLDSIGLINFDNISVFSIIEEDNVEEIRSSYFNEYFQIKLKDKENRILQVGRVIFTQLGLEVLKLCETEPVTGFFEYLIVKLKEQENLEISFTHQNNDKQQSNHSASISIFETDFVKVYEDAKNSQ